MRRADRLFDIIQALRTAPHPVTAAALAEQLEVTTRTIYRDVAALQGSRVPIEGAPGLGYVLRSGYDLPPLMFTSEEADAIAIGVRLLRRLRDAKLQLAAESVLAKLAVVVPEPLQLHPVSAPIYVSEVMRDAIHDARKVAIAYIDEQGRHTHRTIRPIAMAYYVDVALLGAWCELRNDFRNFRVDRISDARLLDERFIAESGRLLAGWLALPKHRPEESLVEPRELVRRAAAI